MRLAFQSLRLSLSAASLDHPQTVLSLSLFSDRAHIRPHQAVKGESPQRFLFRLPAAAALFDGSVTVVSVPPQGDVERKLSQMILDKKFHGE